MEDRKRKGPPRAVNDACRPYTDLKNAYLESVIGKRVDQIKN